MHKVRLVAGKFIRIVIFGCNLEKVILANFAVAVAVIASTIIISIAATYIASYDYTEIVKLNTLYIYYYSISKPFFTKWHPQL